MQKVSYMGNGETTEFNFTFPYYENTNVVVTKNGAAATDYQVIGTSGGVDADIPYVGGKVVFETAPTALDCITIARSLPLVRTVDYQPLAKIDPTTLNQDVNYLMEVLKDLKDEFDTLATQYSEIADKDSTATLLARIAAISEDITDVSAQITALGDISTLRQTVTDLSTTVGGHTTSIGTLDTRTTNLLDYVIASQAPTADNNYTWYRKYKSGWIEQGGYVASSGAGILVTLAVAMSNANYHIILTGKHDSRTAGSTTSVSTNSGAVTATGFYVNNYVENGGNRDNGDAFWWTCWGFYNTAI